MKSLDTSVDTEYLKRKYFPIRAPENISEKLEALNGSVNFGDAAAVANYDLIKAVNVLSRDAIVKSNLFKEPVSLQMVLKWPLLVGQCLGMVILYGISENDTSKLRFKVISTRFIYCMLVLFLQLCTAGLCAARFFRTKVNFSMITFVIFYGGIALTTALFFRIGKKWPALMRRVTKSELADPLYDKKLKNKCLIATVLLMFCAFLEHVLSLTSKFSEILRCYSSFPAIVILYTEENYTWFYEAFTPSTLTMRLAIQAVLQIMNIIAILNWSFSDLFIICISYYLAARLQHVYKKLKTARKRQMSAKFWSTIRQDYNRVARLVTDIDDIINKTIFVSFASNLFFICLQLYNAFSQGVARNRNSLSNCQKENEIRLLFGYEHTIYYLFSLVFLFVRTVWASLIAAEVHSVSLLFAPELYNVPTSLYCIEIQRFLDKLHGEKVALSGYQFFKVTRGLLLSVAGTVVTYELVLLQLDVNDDADDIPNALNNSTNQFSLF